LIPKVSSKNLFELNRVIVKALFLWAGGNGHLSQLCRLWTDTSLNQAETGIDFIGTADSRQKSVRSLYFRTRTQPWAVLVLETQGLASRSTIFLAGFGGVQREVSNF
jgi:hypothetical protein